MIFHRLMRDNNRNSWLLVAYLAAHKVVGILCTKELRCPIITYYWQRSLIMATCSHAGDTKRKQIYAGDSTATGNDLHIVLHHGLKGEGEGDIALAAAAVARLYRKIISFPREESNYIPEATHFSRKSNLLLIYRNP